MVTRGFFGRRRETPPRPIPPGQYLERGFPVLTAGPTQRISLEEWTFTLAGDDGQPLAEWNWQDFRSLPETEIHTDIHCVTKWSKLDTTWKGVTIDDLLASAGVTDPAPYLMAFSYGGYTTNLPTWDVVDGRGMVAYEFDGQPIAPNTAARPAWWFLISTSGNLPSGCAASALCPKTAPVSGNSTAITCMATPGRNNAIGATRPWAVIAVLSAWQLPRRRESRGHATIALRLAIRHR